MKHRHRKATDEIKQRNSNIIGHLASENSPAPIVILTSECKGKGDRALATFKVC